LCGSTNGAAEEHCFCFLNQCRYVTAAFSDLIYSCAIAAFLALLCAAVQSALASSIVAGRFTTEGNSPTYCSGHVPKACKPVAAKRLDPHGAML